MLPRVLLAQMVSLEPDPQGEFLLRIQRVTGEVLKVRMTRRMVIALDAECMVELDRAEKERLKLSAA